MIGIQRIPIKAGAVCIEQCDVNQFANAMEGLVQRETDPSFALGVGDHAVEDEFCEGEDDVSGDEPYATGVNERVSEEGVPPESSGSTLGKEKGLIWLLQ